MCWDVYTCNHSAQSRWGKASEWKSPHVDAGNAPEILCKSSPVLTAEPSLKPRYKNSNWASLITWNIQSDLKTTTLTPIHNLHWSVHSLFNIHKPTQLTVSAFAIWFLPTFHSSSLTSPLSYFGLETVWIINYSPFPAHIKSCSLLFFCHLSGISF